MYEIKNATNISSHGYSKYLPIDKTELSNKDSVVFLERRIVKSFQQF